MTHTEKRGAIAVPFFLCLKKIFQIACIFQNWNDIRGMENITFINNTEKVLWNATFKFFIELGYTQEQATAEADRKIVSKRKMSKTLKFKY